MGALDLIFCGGELTQKTKIRVASKPKKSWFSELISENYDVEAVNLSERPDLFVSHFLWPLYPDYFFNRKLAEADCIKVFITGECFEPDFRFFDYAFSYEETSDRNFQFPGFAKYDFAESLRTGRYSDELNKYRNRPKSKFCNFVYSKTSDGATSQLKAVMRHAFGFPPLSLPRQQLCERLMRYKRVDCPGEALRNMPPLGPGWGKKLDFISRYKFTIAGERISSPYYVTEKICHAFLVNSVPIYWGSPNVSEYFNPEAFINCHDYDDFDGVVKRVMEIDNDDALYRQYAQAPPVLENSRLHDFTREKVIQRVDEIVSSIGVVRPASRTFPNRCRIFLSRPLWRARHFCNRVLWRVAGKVRRTWGGKT